MLETTVHELFDRRAALHADKTAIKDDVRSLSYMELREESRRVARGLWDLGVRHGDRVVLWMSNRVEYVIADLAIARLGAVRVPLNTFLAGDEVAYRFEHTSARVAIVGTAFVDRCADLTRDRDLHVDIVQLPEAPRAEGGLENVRADAVAWSSLLDSPALDPEEVGKVTPPDIAAIMYTGGTTGRSKGVMHTHESSLALSFSAIQEWDIAPDEVMLHVAPLAHAGGFMIYSGLWRGATNLIASKFDAEDFARRVDEDGATWSFLVPTMIYRLLDGGYAKEFDLSSLRTLLYGAAPMAPARVREALEEFGPVLAQAYAQMEALNQATMLTKEDHVVALEQNAGRLASCGRAVAMVNLRIADADMAEVDVGEVGEIVIRSPHVTRGYWADSAQTDDLFQDGWLRTGDMAYRDEGGFVYIVDRAKDMVITGGMNVYSATVEDVLFQHPDVVNAAMFGVPDEEWGEAVVGAVELREGVEVSPEEIIAFCRERLSGYETPKRVEVHESLPLTSYGKIDKRALRAPHWRREERSVS